ncbi:E3 ubiquitin-protein ligase ZNF598 [Anopheles ziemanni]|uniref:E3 ubiquitin-protein ligase ZNF598 n=1 Tax=Anopheles coustani TaxID=139045 RepID=UPI002657D18E|nr:E3 ubiquitin-protein ligase ZNF598 [Anopheles coustani]XP_058168150.1 E3 ubiquitin-protein ligase ZNF598 [Anopheles ziemanni]
MANQQRQRISQEKSVSESETADSVCVVCFKPIVYFAVGECDHLCCYECSTRIRVLCQQNDCPICRRDLAKVIFSKTLMSYQQLDIKNRSGLYDKKYRICFTDTEVQQAFFDLLDNKCPRCDEKNFPKFELLREHVRKKHELFYCDICTEHLKVFSSERRCYNRQELALHRRKGDPDKVGHRGHPLCEYCDTRFLDKDELFRHLRRDHFFCHYCDADGRNFFYGDYATLRDHFRSDHFLCEEGECEQEQFTSVFRSEIDLRAHRASVHGKTMNRLANKQTRTLELEFSYAPRHGPPSGPNSGAGPGGGAAGGGPSMRGGRGGRGGGGRDGGRDGVPGGSGSNEAHQREYEMLVEATHQASIQQHPKKVIDATSEQDFPTLAGATPNPMFRPNNVSIRQRVYGSAGLARTKENFPALGSGGGETTGPTSMNEGFSSKITASSLLKPSQPSGSAGTSMMIHVSNRPSGSGAGKMAIAGKKNQADFPALPGSSKGASSTVQRKAGATSDLFADMDDRSGGGSMVNLNAMSAKHRALADDYVSVSSVVSKVSTVSSKEVKKGPQPALQAAVPSVNSTKAFPTLGDAGKPPAIKAVPWAVGATGAAATNGSSVASTSSSSNVSSKKKPAPAPNLKEDTGYVNLNALTGKKSADKMKQKEQPSTSSNADTRNNNGSAGSKERNREPQKQQQQQHSKSNGQSTTGSLANHTINTNNNVPAMTDSFPALGNHSSPEFAFAAGPKRTPPGFESVNVKRVPGPPPGFGNVTLNSVARNTNNMTFTNSTGDTYNILPSHSYVSPSNFSKRNQNLVTHFQRALKDQAALAEFRTISQMFRDGQYNASAYYEHCKIALGDRFQEIFPELIALLQNIAKQQELYLVYCQDEKNRPKSSGKGKQANASRLEVCQVCKQVLIQTDLTEHYQTHYMENNFPKLANNALDEGKVGSSAWKK